MMDAANMHKPIDWPLARREKVPESLAALSEAELLELEAKYCSHGDTVHYTNPPKIFERCEGSFLFDAEGATLPRPADVVLGRQLRLPQRAPRRCRAPPARPATAGCEPVSCIARRSSSPPCSPRSAEARFGLEGRVHFNVGGSQAIEDSLKLVRNCKKGKSLMFAFEGGYHGRTLGASAITSSYRYRRRYGHFGDRAHFVPFPYHFRGPKGMTQGGVRQPLRAAVRAPVRERIQRRMGLRGPARPSSPPSTSEPIQGTGGYVIPPKNFFVELKKVLDQHGILLVVDEIQMGFYRTGKLFAIEHFGVKPDIIVFGKAITNGLNPLAGIWAREELISPTVFPPGSTHSTFSANPMGTGVALEAMRMMAETDYEAMVMEKGAYLLDGLQDLQRRHKIVGDVDGLGMALRMEICEPHDSFTPSKADRRPHGGRGTEG